MPRRKEPKIPDAILDQLLAGADPKTAFDPNGLLDGLKKALAERALNAEMDHHLTGSDGADSRNGYGKKTVLTDTGRIELEVPRDRQASFDPQLIAKYQRRFPGFDDKIVSMYARGMSTREIQGHLRELYGTDVSPDLVSAVTDAVLEEVAAWQARPLEPVYPLVFFDALRVKIRDEGLVRNKAVHIALGVRADGTKEILGLWLEQNEGAKFWLRVMNELRTRGVEDVLIAVVDGLKGFPDAIMAVFPDATVQTCIVHLLRQSLALVAYKDRKAVAAALKDVYRAVDATAGEAALAAFEEGPWGRRYPAIGQSWRRAWSEVVPFYAFPAEVRRLLYTTNAIETLNSKLRRAVRARRASPA
jgi:putative transposase